MAGRAVAVGSIVMGLIALACGGSESDAPAGAGETTSLVTVTEVTPSTQAASGLSVAETDLGAILVDGEGRTLYLFTGDGEGQSTCYDACAQTWPPFTEDLLGGPGSGIDATLLATAVRTDGAIQVTYNGHPIYYYSGDQVPGETNGHGVGGQWFAVTSEGELAQAVLPPGYEY